jgi:hypothetical protein
MAAKQVQTAPSLPRLPPEILDIILEFALLAKREKPASTGPAVPFHRVRELGEERELHRLAMSGSIAVRRVLFDTPHIATKNRADKLVDTLRKSPHLKRLVKRLSIEIRERELHLENDPHRTHAGSTGVTPLQIAELASLLPNLEELDVLAGDKGGWADSRILAALSRFKYLRHLEVQGLGWKNTLAVCAEMNKLEALKVKGAQPGFVVVNIFAKDGAPSSLSPSFAQTFSTLVLWDCALSSDEFTSLFESFAPAAHLPPTAQPVGGSDALPPPSLRRLTIHNLQALENNVDPIPFNPALLISHLTPLVPHLISLHLVLFERRIIANNANRSMLATMGHLVNGHIASLPDAGIRPGDAFARVLGEETKELTLGGSFCVSRHLYRSLDKSSNPPSATPSTSGDSTRLTRLTLHQCADVGRPSDGLNPVDLLAALDRPWAQSLEVIDVRSMQSSHPTDDDQPLWGEEELLSLTAKAAEINAQRERDGSVVRPITALVDEEVGRRAREEREYYEKMKKRKGKGAKAGRGRSKSVTTAEDRRKGVSGEKNKRKKTVG